jgi:hypothetical protein
MAGLKRVVKGAMTTGHEGDTKVAGQAGGVREMKAAAVFRLGGEIRG